MRDTQIKHNKQPPDSLTRGRKFTAEELQLQVLWFLRESPAHGYELVKKFGEVSRDYYRPSPGVLYPALSQLEALNFAHPELAGKRKIYHISTSGLVHLQQHNETAQLLIARLKHAAKKMLWMSQLPDGETAAADATGWLPEYIQARRALQTALLKQSDASHSEQRRIINILQQAASDISPKRDNQ